MACARRPRNPMLESGRTIRRGSTALFPSPDGYIIVRRHGVDTLLKPLDTVKPRGWTFIGPSDRHVLVTTNAALSEDGTNRVAVVDLDLDLETAASRPPIILQALQGLIICSSAVSGTGATGALQVWNPLPQRGAVRQGVLVLALDVAAGSAVVVRFVRDNAFRPWFMGQDLVGISNPGGLSLLGSEVTSGGARKIKLRDTPKYMGSIYAILGYERRRGDWKMRIAALPGDNGLLVLLYSALTPPRPWVVFQLERERGRGRGRGRGGWRWFTARVADEAGHPAICDPVGVEFQDCLVLQQYRATALGRVREAHPLEVMCMHTRMSPTRVAWMGVCVRASWAAARRRRFQSKPRYPPWSRDLSALGSSPHSPPQTRNNADLREDPDRQDDHAGRGAQ